MELKMWMDKKEQYKKDKAKMFRIIMGQCLPSMRGKIESLPEYKKLELDDNVVGLMAKIKDIAYSTDGKQYEFWTMQAQMRTMLTMQQQKNESLDAFGARLASQVGVTEGVWGSMIPNKEKGKLTDVQEKSRDKFLACVLLAGADRLKYKGAIDKLNNDYISDRVNYPANMADMIAWLGRYRGGGTSNKRVEDMMDGVRTSFAQTQWDRIKCFGCGKTGHVVSVCPERKKNSGNDEDDSESKQRWFEKKTNKSAFQMDDDEEDGDDGQHQMRWFD